MLPWDIAIPGLPPVPEKVGIRPTIEMAIERLVNVGARARRVEGVI